MASAALLTVDAMYALRKASYDIPDRVVRMLARVMVTTPPPPIPRPAQGAGGAGSGWSTVGGGGGGGYHGRQRGGHGGGHGHGHGRGGGKHWGSWSGDRRNDGWRDSAHPSAPVPRRVRVTDNATRDQAKGILNKISNQTYDKLKDDLAAILEEFPDDVPLVSCVAETMFHLGSMSPIFAPLYARMVADLDNQLLMNITIKTYQQYLEKFKTPFKQVNPEEDYDGFCKQNVVKAQRRGFARFIVELYKIRTLKEEDVLRVTDGLLEMLRADAAMVGTQDQVQEYVECLFSICCSLTANTPVKKAVLSECRVILALPKPSLPGLSMRSRFRMQDIVEGKGGAGAPSTPSGRGK